MSNFIGFQVYDIVMTPRGVGMIVTITSPWDDEEIEYWVALPNIPATYYSRSEISCVYRIDPELLHPELRKGTV